MTHDEAVTALVEAARVVMNEYRSHDGTGTQQKCVESAGCFLHADIDRLDHALIAIDEIAHPERCIVCGLTAEETGEILISGVWHRHCAEHLARGGKVRAQPAAAIELPCADCGKRYPASALVPATAHPESAAICRACAGLEPAATEEKPADEMVLRELLWMGHAGIDDQHNHYGDNGEMQCSGIDGHCDFRRDLVARIQEHIERRGRRKWFKAQRPVPAPERTYADGFADGREAARAFLAAWDRAENNRGCYSCSPVHDSRCDLDRGIGSCVCGRVELEATAEVLRRALKAEGGST